jgi:hypothetical protein
VKRTIKLFAVAGALVPILLMSTILVELYIDVHKVPFARLLYPYLWPSSIILAGTNSFDRLDAVDFLILLIAVLANVVLYCLIGLIVAPALELISKWVRPKPASMGKNG